MGDLLQLAGYAAAVLIGVTLGLIGGGGSILTVPALVYLVDVDPVPATAYSLFVVGLTALVGSVAYMRRGLVSYRTAAVFGVPAFLAVFATRSLIVPAIPAQLFSAAGLTVTRDLAIMLLFAALMIAASVSMIRRGRPARSDGPGGETSFRYSLIFLEGVVVGVLTGLVGAGGGFLIIPALVVLARLPMKLAVGTSLLIIAVKSLIGFTGDVMTMSVDWTLLAVFSLLAIGGILLGSRMTRFVPSEKLKPAFGWFTLAMGLSIIGTELVLKTV